jgi:hypothetical protein
MTSDLTTFFSGRILVPAPPPTAGAGEGEA